jgi:hypothetical protein
MFANEYRKMNGKTFVLPDGFKLSIKETSNCIYQIEMFDNQMRSVSNHGPDLDDMVEKAIEDLIKMRK